MPRRIDPRYCNTLIDAHVLDRGGSLDDADVDEILNLAEEGRITLLLPHSVKSEIEHPNTPPDVKRRAARLVYTRPVQLTPPEIDQHQQVRSILQGNAKPGKHDSDAYHVVESAKYGGGYFITNDSRILKMGPEIATLLKVVIVTPAKFLSLYRCFDGGAA